MGRLSGLNGFAAVNQLCTDGFGGRRGHICNLSIKSIVALASFIRLCEEIGEEGENYKVSTIKTNHRANLENGK